MLNKVLISLVVVLFVISGVMGYFAINANSQVSTLKDDTLAFQANTTSQFSTVKSSIASVDSDLAVFQSDTAAQFTGVDGKITGVESDITGVKGDITGVRTDITGVKTDITGVKSDITGVQNSVTGLNLDLNTFKTNTASQFSSTQSTINTLNTGLTTLGTQVNQSTMNVRTIYDTVIGSVCQIIGTTGTGSGFIYRADGYVITCWHVITGQGAIYAKLHDGSYALATVVGSDVNSDVAVLRLTGKTGLTPLTLADSTTLVRGEPVIAVGNPGGIFETVVSGVISKTSGMIFSTVCNTLICNLIQFDAAANPGNSGGPVFNSKGEVIGIDAYGTTAADCMNYAVSSNKIKRVADAIIANGAFANCILPGGWGVNNLTPAIAAARNLNSTFGFVFTIVQNVGNVQTNDICTAVDGVRVTDFADLLNYIALYKSTGNTITLTVINAAGAQATRSVTLANGWY